MGGGEEVLVMASRSEVKTVGCPNVLRDAGCANSLLASVFSFVKWRQLTYNVVSISWDHFVKQFGLYTIDCEQL